MSEQAAAAAGTKVEIKSRWTGAVLFSCDVPDEFSGMAMRYALEKATAGGANLRGANLRGANLGDANLGDADLGVFKADFFDILLRAPREIDGLRDALVGGRVDGSTYFGECACLVGTIAKVRDVNYAELGNGITPNSSRPAEQWFMSIGKGDTPENNSVSRLTVEWVDEFLGLLAAARVA